MYILNIYCAYVAHDQLIKTFRKNFSNLNSQATKSFFKRRPIPYSFCFHFVPFKQYLFGNNEGVRTRITRAVEGEHADHLTTTTVNSSKYCCRVPGTGLLNTDLQRNSFAAFVPANWHVMKEMSIVFVFGRHHHTLDTLFTISLSLYISRSQDCFNLFLTKPTMRVAFVTLPTAIEIAEEWLCCTGLYVKSICHIQR